MVNVAPKGRAQMGVCPNLSGPVSAVHAAGGQAGWTAVLRRVDLSLPLILYLLLRAPSWFEPHWYTDEAGYATTAWLSTHGSTLYLTVWNNKPPLLFWIYDVAIWIFGPSEMGLHLFSTLTGLIALVMIWRILRLRYHGLRVAVPLILAALLLGMPLLNGDLALPENFLIAPEAAAMLCLLWALTAQRPRAALLAAAGSGVLFGIACLIQQTSLGPAALAVVMVAAVKGRRGLPQLAALVLGLAVVVGAGIAPYLFWAGAHNVYYYLVKSYEQYTTNSLPLTPLMLAPRAAAGLLLVAGIFWRRHHDPFRLVALAWLGVELLVFALPNRPYAHFLLPAVAPACLLVAGVRLPHPSRWPGRRMVGAALPASLIISLGLWVLLILSNPSTAYTLGLTNHYYQDFMKLRLGSISTAQYYGIFGTGQVAEAEAIAVVKTHHLQGQTALVWASDAWPYLLGSLQPVVPTPAIYQDQVWLGDSGLERLVVSSSPQVVYLSHPSSELPSWIGPYLEGRYREVESGAGGSSLWVRGGTTSQIQDAHLAPG
jgi:hypothetical protein